MAKIKGQARQTVPQQVNEGGEVELRLNRSGSLVVETEIDALIKEGRGFQTIVGAFSTPVTGGGKGTVIDIDQPDLLISIPSGTSIKPFKIDVVIEKPVGVADDDVVEALIAVDQDAAASTATAGTSTAGTIYNLNTLFSRNSNCAATTQYSADTHDPVLDLELAHFTCIFELFSSASIWESQRFLRYEPLHPIVINGPASLIVYFGGTVEVQAFVTAQWVEFPTTYVS